MTHIEGGEIEPVEDLTDGDEIHIPELTRRRFLIAVSALVAAPLVPVGDRHVAAATVATTVRRLSVGYIERSDRWPDLSVLPWQAGGVLGLARSIPARSPLAGDRSFVGRDAVVTVHGLYPSLRRVADRTITRVALDADLRANDPARPLLFYASTIRAGPRASTSQRSVFSVRVGSAASLGFALDVKRGTTRTRSRVVFGVGTGTSIAKLRRGAYLLALDPTVWDSRRSLPAVGTTAWSRIPSLIVTVDHPPR